MIKMEILKIIFAKHIQLGRGRSLIAFWVPLLAAEPLLAQKMPHQKIIVPERYN